VRFSAILQISGPSVGVMQVWTPANYRRRLSPDRNEAVIFLAFSLAFCLVLFRTGLLACRRLHQRFRGPRFESQTVPYLGMVPTYAGASVDIKLKGSDSSLSALRICCFEIKKMNFHSIRDDTILLSTAARVTRP
jgi:hypothetical protein